MKYFHPMSIIFWLIAITTSASALSLDSCYQLARKNYPLIKQLDLIVRTGDYTSDNLAKGLLPQLSIGGQATYQSEVTKVPIALPNLKIPEMNKDQYKIYAEVSQPITDGITINDQRKLVKTNAAIEAQRMEVDLYKLRDRINALYFGILLTDGQLLQTDILRKDLQTGLDKAKVAIANGTALRSSEDLLQAEWLKTDQREAELQAAKKSYIEMLSLFIGAPLDAATTFDKPLSPELASSNKRPELEVYALQRKSLDIQRELLHDRNVPRLSLFLQGGYGRPALNMLSNDFTSYYIGGLRLNWNVSSFYTSGKEKDILGMNQKAVEIQQEVFLLNTNMSIKQTQAEAEKLQKLMKTDRQIIEIRNRIKETTLLQLQQGTATSGDYLLSINAEDQARQNLLLHEIQLILSSYNHKQLNGN